METKTRLTPEEKFVEMYKEFMSVCQKYSDFGAADEGDHIIARCIRKALNGNLEVPTTAGGWDLFTCEMKCGVAARALTASAKKLCTFVHKNRDSMKFTGFVHGYVG